MGGVGVGVGVGIGGEVEVESRFTVFVRGAYVGGGGGENGNACG